MLQTIFEERKEENERKMAAIENLKVTNTNQESVSSIWK